MTQSTTISEPRERPTSAVNILRLHVKEALKESPYSYREIALKCGVSHYHFKKLMSGRSPMSLDTAEKILGVINHHVQIFVTRKEKRTQAKIAELGAKAAKDREARRALQKRGTDGV